MDLGVAAWAGGRTREAEDLLEKSVERAAKSGMSVHSQRLYYFARFQFYAAQDLLERAEHAYVGVESSEKYRIYAEAGNNLGVLRMRAGKYPEAVEILRITRTDLDNSTGSGDERIIEIMVLMHLDLAQGASGSPDPKLSADVASLFDDMVRFQQGDYPKLHGALLREVQDYEFRLRAAGRNAEAQAIHERLNTQLARGALPGTTDGTCLSYRSPAPLGCLLGLAQ